LAASDCKSGHTLILRSPKAGGTSLLMEADSFVIALRLDFAYIRGGYLDLIESFPCDENWPLIMISTSCHSVVINSRCYDFEWVFFWRRGRLKTARRGFLHFKHLGGVVPFFFDDEQCSQSSSLLMIARGFYFEGKTLRFPFKNNLFRCKCQWHCFS